ncbi:MAG: hypothetical protein EOP84_31965 [Verrucomicrobiaceae bacterium]|nr:MAG: hypothetical protein EOP84_31965 [Verrucomicrobiaceae bacterium]
MLLQPGRHDGFFRAVNETLAQDYILAHRHNIITNRLLMLVQHRRWNSNAAAIIIQTNRPRMKLVAVSPNLFKVRILWNSSQCQPRSKRHGYTCTRQVCL